MPEIRIPSSNVVIKGSDDEIVLEAPLLELYYVIAFSGDLERDLTPRERAQRAAGAINKEYGIEITWYQVAAAQDYIVEEMEAAKKNSTSMLESLRGTESKPLS